MDDHTASRQFGLKTLLSLTMLIAVLLTGFRMHFVETDPLSGFLAWVLIGTAGYAVLGLLLRWNFWESLLGGVIVSCGLVGASLAVRLLLQVLFSDA